jgi:hypothetical protein
MAFLSMTPGSYNFFNPNTFRRVVIALIFLGGTGMGLAQPASLSGRVTDSKTNEPVLFATIFLANTSFGAITRDGNYRLQNIPVGKYNLTVSCVGYKLVSIPVDISAGDKILNIQLEQQTTILREVVIKSNNAAYLAHMRMFKKYFLGETSNASQCSIKNEVAIDLDFDDVAKVLTASSTEPIEIENLALGYRVVYLLKEFRLDFKGNICIVEGIPRFEYLTPKNEAQLHHWIRERNRAYYGSMNHFMRSLKYSCLEEEDFFIYLMNKTSYATLVPGLEREKRNDTLFSMRRITASDLFAENPDSHILLKVVYTGESQEYNYDKTKPGWLSKTNYEKTRGDVLPQTSYLRFVRQTLVIHDNGYYDNALSIYMDGYLGWSEKIAELLPLEYQPIPKPRKIHQEPIVQLPPDALKPAIEAGSISGKVVNSKTHEPVTSATVYLVNTLWKTTVGQDGMYHMEGIPRGKYDLGVSMAGFQDETVVIPVPYTEKMDILLEQDTTLRTDKRKDEPANLWVRTFKKYFLGETLNAAKCVIKNMDVVEFKYY